MVCFSSRGICMDNVFRIWDIGLVGCGENVMGFILEMLVDMFVGCRLFCR